MSSTSRISISLTSIVFQRRALLAPPPAASSRTREYYAAAAATAAAVTNCSDKRIGMQQHCTSKLARNRCSGAVPSLIPAAASSTAGPASSRSSGAQPWILLQSSSNSSSRAIHRHTCDASCCCSCFFAPSPHRRWKSSSTDARIQQQIRTPSSSQKKKKRSNSRKQSNNPSKSINLQLLQMRQHNPRDDSTLNQLLDLYVKRRLDFDAVNYATLLRQLVQLQASSWHPPKLGDDPRLLTLLDELADRIENAGFHWLSARSAASILHALAKLRLFPNNDNDNSNAVSRIFHWISQPETATQLVQQQAGKPMDLANVAWSCATLQYPAPHLFLQLEQQAPHWMNSTDCNAQDVSITLWSYATLGHAAPVQILQYVEANATRLVQEGSPQAIVNTAWACATMGVPVPRFLTALDQNVPQCLEGATPQAVANAAWSCATLQFAAPRLFEQILRNAAWLVAHGTHQAVSMVAWSCATLQIQDADPLLWTPIYQRAAWLVREGDPQTVANLAWACATTNTTATSANKNENTNLGGDGDGDNARYHHQQQQLFGEIEHRADWLAATADAQEIANTLWAFARLGYHAPHLAAAVHAQAHRIVPLATPQELANVAWGLAIFGGNNDDGNGIDTTNDSFFHELDRNLDLLLQDGQAQHLTSTCYAIAVLGLARRHKDSLVQLWDRAMELLEMEDTATSSSPSDAQDTEATITLGNESMHQLLQTYFFAGADGVSLNATNPTFLSKCQRIESDEKVSETSKNISRLLHQIGFEHECEVAPADGALFAGGMLAIDFASQDPKIAIEFDGPSHFLLKTCGDSDSEMILTENGPTRAKRRYLQQLGWLVVNLHYRDYEQARRDAREKEWLREALSNSCGQHS